MSGRDFWIIVHALPLEDKKKLLRFATGSDRVPIRGLSNLVFVISQRAGLGPPPHSAHLVRFILKLALTMNEQSELTRCACVYLADSFNHLLLPEYSSRDKLQERLLLAISQAEGFGLR